MGLNARLRQADLDQLSINIDLDIDDSLILQYTACIVHWQQAIASTLRMDA